MFTLLFGLIAAAVAIAAFVFWIMMIVDCVKNPRLSDTEKIVWVLVIVFLHVLGAFIYFLAGRGERVI